MNNSGYVKRNVISTVALQVVTIICGLILPKLILSYFGSNMNGLVASITQYLNYIQLLEGGVSSVIMAALYKPLSERDDYKISSIVKATEKFFKQIGLIYIVYTVIIALVYPVIVNTGHNYMFVVTLVLIIGISTCIQYLFSLTYRILINADRKGFIVSLTNIAFLLVNLLLTVVAFKVYPEIHLIKFINAISFVIQPIVFSFYVKRHYNLKKDVEPDTRALSQRWAGFGQNLAYFIHSNTDIVIITFFSLNLVSVYWVYLMIISAVRNLINSISTAIAPSMGNIIVSQTDEKKNQAFDKFEFVIGLISTTMFTCCLLLIVQFVLLYTKNVNDADYNQPVFAVIFCLAEAIYCLRTPYISVAYSVGHFKQTSKYSYIEAGTNIVLSLILVQRAGLIGVAIGTLVSMAYRMVMHIIYLRKHILHRSCMKCVKNLVPFILSGASASAVVLLFINMRITGYFTWFLYAVVVGVIVCSFQLLFMMLLRRKMLVDCAKTYLFRKKR